jgi:hypothetical protein
VRPWVQDRLTRATRGARHPVRDFLFEYYHFRPAHLARWSPGACHILDDARPAELDWPTHYSANESQCEIRPESFPPARRELWQWTRDYLRAVATRPAFIGCFGLHEWAMLYRTTAPRHDLPFRVSIDVLEQTVESLGLYCTHFDAFRFFTPPAAPRNVLQLTRADVIAHEQPGCVHATMDVYKHAHRFAPFVPSSLIADAFELAWQARELDMAASPYDVSRFGLDAVAIETAAGRAEYQRRQQLLGHTASVLREQLLAALDRLIVA